MNFWILLAYLHVVLAAKQYLFKTCEQNGFCKRNLQYGENKLETKVNNYHVNGDVKLDSKNAIVSGDLVKNVNGVDVILPFELGVLNDLSFRFTIDEQRVTKKGKVTSERYSPSEVAEIHYQSMKNVAVSQRKDRVEIESGDVTIVLYKDFRIDYSVNKELQMVINKDLFLNFEHYRLKTDNKNNLLPEEIEFNMFEDNFSDSQDDKLPLGPESVAVDFDFIGFKHAYGIPEHSNSLNLNDEIYRLYNVDIFEYEIDSNLPMYGSIPFLMVTKPEVTLGMFWINGADTYINVKKGEDLKTHWMSEAGKLDFIVFHGKTPAEVNYKYGKVTGFTTLPQLFSLGYHQCRWNYNSDQDIMDITAKFDEHEIPYDTIWLDIEYTVDKKYFTWNTNFPDPHKLLNDLDHTGRNLVIIIDPHIKTDYEVSEYLIKNRLTIMDNRDQPFKGHCWPGESVWVDAFNPKCQAYWDTLHDVNGILYNNTNIHLWNDMNEISVFDGPETSGPKDLIHHGGFEDRAVHNLNGYKFHELTYNALIKRLDSLDTSRQRPFILTRSYFAGLQKTAAMWTGDNMSKWEYLKISIPMVLNNGIAGMPFAGADVGGFFGDPSKELLTRWYQTGIWYPFFRAHAHLDSRRREPWVPREPFTSIIKDAIRLRYSLLPEFYNAFRESSVSGLPIMKPVFYETPSEKTFGIEDEFFLGNSGILVKPITEENNDKTTIIFPDNEVYYDFKNGVVSSTKYTNKVTMSALLSEIPMVLKGGSIIFRKERYRRSSKLMKNDPYTLVIAPDSKGQASGSLYVDDYESFEYTSGNYLLTKVELKNNILSNKIVNEYAVGNTIEKIVILATQATDVVVGTKQVPFESVNGNIIIKNPKVNVGEAWKIKLDMVPVHDEL